MLPVDCLDDFESLLKRTEELDNNFYNNLRSLMNDNALMLVQLTCYEVVELLNRDIRENRRDACNPKATARDVQTVIPTVLERGGEYFRELWKS